MIGCQGDFHSGSLRLTAFRKTNDASPSQGAGALVTNLAASGMISSALRTAGSILLNTLTPSS